MSKVMLFLGAGASKAFEYPTTKEFLDNLQEVLSEEEKRVLNSIVKTPEVRDIEHVLQILDPIIEFDSNPFINRMFRGSTAPYITLEGVGLHWEPFIQLCKELKEDIISELHRQYEFAENKLEKIVECYDRLFGSVYYHVPKSMRAKEFGQMHVFTTNYDSVVEYYCAEKHIDFTCGFELERFTRRQFWKPELFRKYQGLKLYKLHGSLDWRETNDGRIERVPTEEQVSKTTRRHKRNVLIYPAQKEYLTEEPFRTLMDYFEKVLNEHDVCLVIGFSFRDPSINRIFLDFLKANSKRKLIAVSPTASDNVKENLVHENKRLKKQILCLDMSFGEQKTFIAIRDVLRIL